MKYYSHVALVATRLPGSRHAERARYPRPERPPSTVSRDDYGNSEGAGTAQQTTKWYSNAYLHADRVEVLQLDESDLEGRQFGGKHNYG